MKKLFTLSFLLASLFANANTYYISLTGNNGNSGLTEALAWRTLTYALSSGSPVVAGDIIHVKGGNYANENIVVQKSGSCGANIQVIGYTSIPGDSPSVLINNSNPYVAYNTAVMPTYTGTSRANGGICFDMRNSKYISIDNFQILQYGYGIITGGTTQIDYGFHKFTNVNMMNLGDLAASYDGRAFSIGNIDTSRSSSNIIRKCLIVNSKAEGITLSGNNNLVENCKIYSNEVGDATQYYLTIFGNDNLVKYCHAEQDKALTNGGTHGFSIKSNAEKVIDAGLSYPTYNPMKNKIMYCTARNIGESFAFRHRGVQYNLVYHCRAYGTHKGTDGDQGLGSGGVFRDGCYGNTIDGLIVDSTASGIDYYDTTEDGDTGGSPTGHPCNNNKVINSTFSNCYTPINFSDYGIASDAGDNLIANCTFYLARYLHYAGRRCTTMRYENNIYYGNSAVGSGGYFRGYTYSSDVVQGQFKNCTFYNIDGGLPGGFSSTGQLTSNPDFGNATARIFTLNVGSPSIASGVTSPVAETSFTVPFTQFENLETNSIMFLGLTKEYLRPAPNITRNYLGVIYTGGTARNRGAY